MHRRIKGILIMNKKKYWLDKKANITKIYIALWTIGIFLILGDFVIHRHEDFKTAELFGFYGVYGFVGCVILVLVAKVLRKIVMRNEDYYDT